MILHVELTMITPNSLLYSGFPLNLIEFHKIQKLRIPTPHKKALHEAGLTLAKVVRREGITRPARSNLLLERKSSSQSTNNDVVIMAVLIGVGNPNNAWSHSDVIRKLELVEPFKVPRSIISEA